MLCYFLISLYTCRHTVNRIHHLMTVLLLLKILSLMFKTVIGYIFIYFQYICTYPCCDAFSYLFLPPD